MYFIDKIPKKEYENFLKNNTESHFQQSYEWGKFCQKNKKVIPHYVGLKENNKLIATALLLEKRLPMRLSYFYSPRGYILNYSNKNTIKIFTNEIKKYIKRYNAIFIKIDPAIKLHNLNNEGNIENDKINNYKLIDYLKSIGYKHMGFNKNFENSNPRYTFRLSLDKSIDNIISSFHPTTRKIIKRGNPYGLKIIKNDINLIDDFYTTMEQTAKRENIALYSIDYYRNFYLMLHKNNMSDLYVVKADIKFLKEYYTKTIKELNEKVKSITSLNKKNEYISQLNKALKEKQELDKINASELTLSSIITAKYNDKIWTIHGGNHSLLRSLNSNYLIYFEIIKDACNAGYKTIDFFGTTGNPNPKSCIYGIHLFKKRLGGEYTEFIGEFDLVTKPFMYFIFTTFVPFLRKIKREKNKERIKKCPKCEKERL